MLSAGQQTAALMITANAALTKSELPEAMHAAAGKQNAQVLTVTANRQDSVGTLDCMREHRQNCKKMYKNTKSM